jgi:hypothetical protein
VDWACSTKVGEENACRLLMEKPEGKSPLGRPRRSLENNIKIDLLEMGWGGVDWASSTIGGEEYRV